jgi:hypothetical protein
MEYIMLPLNRSDLQYTYDWTASPSDNPKLRGEPDSSLLNRHQDFEVLYFINEFGACYNLKYKALGLKVEALIQLYLPDHIRHRAKIEKWLIANWDLLPNDIFFSPPSQPSLRTAGQAFSPPPQPSLKTSIQAFPPAPSLKDYAHQEEIVREARRTLGPMQATQSLGLKDSVKLR